MEAGRFANYCCRISSNNGSRIASRPQSAEFLHDLHPSATFPSVTATDSFGVKGGQLLLRARSRSKGSLSDQVADAPDGCGQCRGGVGSSRMPLGGQRLLFADAGLEVAAPEAAVQPLTVPAASRPCWSAAYRVVTAIGVGAPKYQASRPRYRVSIPRGPVTHAADQPGVSRGRSPREERQSQYI